MALKHGLQSLQKQGLAATEQVQQSLAILRMSNLELSEFLQSEAIDNPFISIENKPEADLQFPFSQGQPFSETTASDFIRDTVANPVSLNQHLLNQLSLSRFSPEKRHLVEILIGELDERGYILAPLAQIAEDHDKPINLMERALFALQGMEPAGIGARNLGEALSLQLKSEEQYDEVYQALISDLEDGWAISPADSLKNYGIVPQQLADRLRRLRSLNPEPGAAFLEIRDELVQPDVFVFPAADGNLSVELNLSAFPKIIVDNSYKAVLTGDNQEFKKHVSECTRKGTWYAKAIEKRANTILEIATAIAVQQSAFFINGFSGLKPMTATEIAQRLNVNQSTVSRAIANKYVSCDFGVFPMKSLFSSALQTTNKEEPVSSATVREAIKRICDAEEPDKILSDSQISKTLKESGIVVARRTVAKYREHMNVPSSSLRRKLKRLL